jgi:hypothetical protein
VSHRDSLEADPWKSQAAPLQCVGGPLSIPSNSVLRRILEEVLAGPVSPGLAPAERGDAPGQSIEVWRSFEVHRPPFSTSLHFWAHALRALLAERGRSDAFGALASHCLCEAVPSAEVARAIVRLGHRLGPSFRIERNEGYRAGYRMIEQDELVSWVAELEDEFVALFWMRPSWLATAQPLPIEPIEFVEPE